MSSAEKARIKKAAAEELRQQLEGQIAGEERQVTLLKGGVAATEAALQQIAGAHKKLEKDLEDGTVSADEYKVAKGYLTMSSHLVTNQLRSMRAQIPASGFRVESYRKAINIVASYAGAQGRIAERAEREEIEEDEYRADLAERRAEPEPAEPAPSKQDNGNAPHPPEELTDESDRHEEEPPPCKHCSEPVTMHTGSLFCTACTSYKNRYDKLPPEHVLEARRKRKEEAGADT